MRLDGKCAFLIDSPATKAPTPETPRNYINKSLF